MEPSVRIWLVAFALVCVMGLEFANCRESEVEFEKVKVMVSTYPNHERSWNPSSRGLWESVTGSDIDVSGRYVQGWYSAARRSKNDRRMKSGREGVLRISYSEGESVRGFPLGKSAAKGGSDNREVKLRSSTYYSASTVSSWRGSNLRNEAERESRISRALLQQQSGITCPLDFRGMREFPWYAQTCQNPDTLDSNGNYECCTVLMSALGQAESQYLRTTGQFRLKDEATVKVCLANLDAELHAENNSLDTNLIMPRCFPESNYSMYVTHPYNCQGIENRTDFETLVGQSVVQSSLDPPCSESLADTSLCFRCVQAINAVIYHLQSISTNNSDCLFYTLFYAAGISNANGPYNAGTAQCILAVHVANTTTSNDSKTLVVHIVIGAASAFAASLFAAVVFFVWWKRRRDAIHRDFVERHMQLLQPAMMRPNTGLIEYSFEEITAATNNFSSKNYIGSGGFGDVYRGVLDDGLVVAIKRMKNRSADGDADFINEVNVINSVRHRNLVILRGCCVTSTDSDGHQRLLVHDFMPNGSLYDHLFVPTKKTVLSWPDRRRLAIGMAKGIAYLHNDARPPIIHRDIKASNVLLDENLNAKVADFGLAKFCIEGQTTTAIVGTPGYVAPEYALYGQLTDKSDVYSFGVLLLELMSGRSALDGFGGNYSFITDWAWAKVKEGRLLDIVDERIRKGGPKDVMERFVLVGILCSHMLVTFRPSMEEALKYLEGDIPLPHIHNRPLPVNREMPLDDAPALSPRPPINVVSDIYALSAAEKSESARSNREHRITAVDELSAAHESEAARLYREQRTAMAEFSGTSAGVPTASLLR